METKDLIPDVERRLALLRARMVEIARARVAAEAVDDVVQEALAIIYEKGGGTTGWTVPAIPWCFLVLRNVIGNYYQLERTRRSAARPGTQAHTRIHDFTMRAENPTPLESLGQAEVSRLCSDAIAELASRDRLCGEYLRDLLQGSTRVDAPRRLESVTSTDYVRRFRCREKLKAILAQRGYSP